jgi:hypothetical protein
MILVNNSKDKEDKQGQVPKEYNIHAQKCHQCNIQAFNGEKEGFPGG